MKKVQRHDIAANGKVQPQKDGRFVLYADYRKLEKLLKKKAVITQPALVTNAY